MSKTGFEIYNASAGSGKTYQLTKSYLRLILAPTSKQKYAQLLAITFTNKAVGEMKQRILQSLYDFGLENVPNSSNSLFEEIKVEYNYSSEDLKIKAQSTLKELLHNYAFFEISTIDKFNHKIIRTFARDLKLAQNFEVELDTDALLNQAVARVLNKAGSDKMLTQFIIDFAIEKIDANKSWNIAYDLTEIGKLLFRENHTPHLKNLQNKSIKDFISLKQKIKSDIEQKKGNIQKMARKNLELISLAGLMPNDFNRSWFPNFMTKAVDSPASIDFKAGWKQNFETAPLYTKSCAEDIKTTIDELRPTFVANFNTIKSDFEILSFLLKVYKKVVPLTLINEISKELKNLQEEQNVLSIAEFNTIISNEIKNQPVPFIYERLGEKYRHYFIDEFQDTSKMQWQNLIPLIGNALESENEIGEKGSLLLVGDVKQAIYRWRGGEASQFLNLALETKNPFVVGPSVQNLNKNWRSFSEIIAFNNHFFSFAATALHNTVFQQLYKNGNKQLKNDKSGGYVELAFIEDHKQEVHEHCIKTMENIELILKKGFSYQDISILVRSNTQGILIADFLTKKGVPLISAEALLLKNAEEVNFLIALLYLIEQPDHKEFQFVVLEFFAQRENLKHDFIVNTIAQLKSFLDTRYGFKIDEVKLLPPTDILEIAISKFDIVPDSNAYVTYLLDEVFAFGQKENLSIFDFLQYWERKKDTLSIAAPENLDAVSVMTIHKSKGLEFPFVIFPFATSKIDDKTKSNDVWISVPENDFCGFNELMLRSAPELEVFSEEAKSKYEKESNAAQLDDFNVLYVSLTRAICGLFIITSPPNKNSKGNQNQSYSSLFANYLKEQGAWNDAQSIYTFGNLDLNQSGHGQKESQTVIPYIYSRKDHTHFNIATSATLASNQKQKEAIAMGNLLHKVLSLVYSKTDIDSAISTFLTNGEISRVEGARLSEILHKIVKHDKLKAYFAENLTVYNEIEILKPDGSLARPDRIVIDEKMVTIIDYKTGDYHKSHKNQLEEYAVILSKMGYFVSKKILIYIDTVVNPIFV